VARYVTQLKQLGVEPQPTEINSRRWMSNTRICYASPLPNGHELRCEKRRKPLDSPCSPYGDAEGQWQQVNCYKHPTSLPARALSIMQCLHFL
jgi:hypothetical protein